jgi:hypothetical protein
VNIRHGRAVSWPRGKTLKTLTLNEVARAGTAVRLLVPSFVGAAHPSAERRGVAVGY